MTCSRWIRVCVDMLDHPVVGINVPPPRPKDPSRHAVQPAMAWLDLLCAASWKERKVHHKDKIITLKRGEFIAGRAYWAKRWNWGEQAVRSFFARLIKCEMIAISNQSLGHTANIVSICNYDLYQGALTDSQPEEKPVLNQCSTSAQPETNQTVYRNNKDTRDINNITPTDSPEYVAAREGPTDREPDEIKSAFNGQTATMLSDIVRWMGPHGDEDAARKWLSSLLSINGREATGQAYQMLMTAQAEGQPVARPLAWWSKTAATLKANPQAKPPPPHVTDFREAKRQRDREFFRALGLMS